MLFFGISGSGHILREDWEGKHGEKVKERGTFFIRVKKKILVLPGLLAYRIEMVYCPGAIDNILPYG